MNFHTNSTWGVERMNGRPQRAVHVALRSAAPHRSKHTVSVVDTSDSRSAGSSFHSAASIEYCTTLVFHGITICCNIIFENTS